MLCDWLGMFGGVANSIGSLGAWIQAARLNDWTTCARLCTHLTGVWRFGHSALHGMSDDTTDQHSFGHRFAVAVAVLHLYKHCPHMHPSKCAFTGSWGWMVMNLI